MDIQTRAIFSRVFSPLNLLSFESDLTAATLIPNPAKPQPSIHNRQSTPCKQPHGQPPTERPKRSQADKRIDFLLKNKFDNDPDFRPLLIELADLDPTPKKKYLAWLVKHWLGDWKATNEEKRRVAGHLAAHNQGAKYFSPLSWTGLRLEDAGYHADIFRYTPDTIAKLSGEVAEIIRIDEGDKQIRKGNMVALAGAEIVHRDDQFTIIRIRTGDALKRFGQNTSWCVRHGNSLGYPFPFDFILDHEGNRYLANRTEVRDQWDRQPTNDISDRINKLRSQVFDSREQHRAMVHRAIGNQERLDQKSELLVMACPDAATEYAVGVLKGPWKEFEERVRVADLSPQQAVQYAIRARKKPWPRFENRIKRSVGPLADYREAFPGSIPKTDEEIFKEELHIWRWCNPDANNTPMRRSVQGRAESLERIRSFDERIVPSRYSLHRYTKLQASLATSSMASRYHEKVTSYFVDWSSEFGKTVNLPIARELCRRFDQRMKVLEEYIAQDTVCSMNYAEAIGERFLDGEAAILGDSKVAQRYRRRFLRPEPETKVSLRNDSRGSLGLPTNFKVPWR